MLSGKYQDGARPEGARFSRYLAMEGQRQAAMALRFVNDRTLAATARYPTIAGEAGLHPATLATAWSKQHDFVASTIVGVSAEAPPAPTPNATHHLLTDQQMEGAATWRKDHTHPAE